MIKVWVLYAYIAAGHSGGPMIIDNLISQEECVRVSKVVFQNAYVSQVRCIEVVKAKRSGD